MRRSNIFIKIMTGAFFVALLIYVGYTIYGAVTNVFRTSGVYTETVEDSCEVRGFVVRNEQILSGEEGCYLLVSDGEKVSPGQKLAAFYPDSSYAEISEELSSLNARKEQITRVISGLAEKSNPIDVVYSLVKSINSGDLTAARSASDEIKASLFKLYGTMTKEELASELSAVSARINEINTLVSSIGAYVYADSEGTFSSVADGYEGISPDTILPKDADGNIIALTPSGYDSLFSYASVPSKSFGKMIDGINWYYITVTSEENAAKLTTGKSCAIFFEDIFSASISMTVESISAAENGRCTVTLSCSKFLQDIADARVLFGKITFSSFSGIHVPKQAVYQDSEGQAYLYILRAIQAKRVNIELISDMGDYYIVEDDGSIPLNAEIIVKANDLYDGKVVQ